MFTSLYKLSLYSYPLARRALALLPAPVQRGLKRKVRAGMAKHNAQAAARAALKAVAGGISVAGLNEALAPGVNVIGAVKANSGLGVYARATLESLAAAQVPQSAVNYTHGLQHEQDDESCARFLAARPAHVANIFCLNADMLALHYQKSPADFDGHYNIHYNAWELSRYPADWMPAMNLAHEMWAISTFMQQSAAASATIPVLAMGIAVDCATDTRHGRNFFGLPDDRFLFVFSFDVSSVTERKNPQAALRAFTQAFAPARKDVGLVVKINFIPGRPEQAEKVRALKKAWAHDARIVFIDRPLARGEMVNLLSVCDSYVSLHRAEGFGLGIAEAMLLGKPVIATNYSGNTDFTRAHNSCLVDYTLVPVGRGEYPFEEGQVWADADSEHAAHFMRALADDRALCERLGGAGRATISSEFSRRAIGAKMRERLDLLGLLP